MDPLANLKEQRTLAHDLLTNRDYAKTDAEGCDILDDAIRLAELVIALDKWRISGGFDPYGETPASLAELDRFNNMQRRALTAEAKLNEVRNILTRHLESGSEG